MHKKIESILRNASKLIKQSNRITYKEKDIVTSNDLKVERYIIEKISAIYPEDLFISEEENQNELTDHRTWIIDPIDGTLNYTRDIPQYGIQLALYENKEAIFSMMYFPVQDDIIYAFNAGGCYYNHTLMTPDREEDLSKAILTFGDFSKSNMLSRPTQLKLMSKLVDHVMKIRIYGASSTDFFYVVTDKTQCHILFSKRIWELSAGMLLATEAGLCVETFIVDGVEGLIIGSEKIIKKIRAFITP